MYFEAAHAACVAVCERSRGEYTFEPCVAVCERSRGEYTFEPCVAVCERSRGEYTFKRQLNNEPIATTRNISTISLKYWYGRT